MSWSEIRNGGELTGYSFTTLETIDGVDFTYTDEFNLDF